MHLSEGQSVKARYSAYENTDNFLVETIFTEPIQTLQR